MPLMTTSGTAQDIINAAVRAEYNRALEEQASELYYSDLGLNDYEPDVPAEIISGITGPGTGQLSYEGQAFFSNTKQREWPVTVALRYYTSELSWTDQDIHWLEKANSSSKRVIDFKNMPSQHVQALNQNINQDACKVFYLGFGTTFITVGNAEALYASHTLRVGGTQTNIISYPSNTVNPPLTNLALASAIASQMDRFKAQNGNQELRCRKINLIVPPELRPTAMQIKMSDYGPNNNSLGLQVAGPTIRGAIGVDLNVVVGMDIPTGYSTYWFLSETNRARLRAFMAWGWKPRLNEHPDFRKGIWYNDASALFGPVIQGWQWTAGSKGTSAA